MRVVRNAAQRGFILPERGYPIRTPASATAWPRPPLVLGITRQESSFDPQARSGAGARGMMQLMPATASIVARRIGSRLPGQLDDPDYNMRLGSAYLGQLVDQFSGSYVHGRGRLQRRARAGRRSGSAICGDPRGASTDPVDFIECIPFSETRNYVMRVLEDDAGLPRQAERRRGPDHACRRPEARRLRLRRPPLHHPDHHSRLYAVGPLRPGDRAA